MSDPGERVDGTRWLDAAEQRSWRALVMGMTLLDDRLDEDLRRSFDLSLAEYEILTRLSECDDRRMRMAKLADAMAYSRSRVTHTVARLEKSGLVARRHSDVDGRGVDCLLTADGMKLLERCAPVHVTGVREYLLDQCSAEDFSALVRVMNAVSDYLIGDRPGLEIRDRA